MTAIITLLLLPTVQTQLYAQVQERRDFSVTAIVPPSQGDFQFNFASDGQTTVPQRTVLNYEVTYGAQASAGTDTETTITIDFRDDEAPGGSHVLDYVIGSASTAYGGVVPVVDLLNRTITWTIPALPAGTTNQTVTFQLRTNENYTEPDPVSFTTRARLSNDFITFPDQTETQTYQFDLSLVTPTPTLTPIPSLTPTPTMTPTPTPGPTSTPGPQPTAIPAPTTAPTPTPAQKPNNVSILDVRFDRITDSSTDVTVNTNRPAQVTVLYGTDESSLNRTAISSAFARSNTLTISQLNPSTRYYFQVVAIDSSGQSIRSEIFTFTTAAKSTVPQAQNDAVVIKSGETVLLSRILNQEANNNFVILPTTAEYQVFYTFTKPQQASSIEIVVSGPDGIDRRVKMATKDSITYVAHLRTGKIGTYNVLMYQSDQKGNIMSRKISDFKSGPPIRILESELNTPLADARAALSIFNTKSNAFEPLDMIFYSNSIGEVSPVLLPGRYKVDVSAWGYGQKSVEFTLGSAQGEEYPTVRLKKNPFDLTYLINTFYDWSKEFLNTSTSLFKNLSSSVRLFYFVGAVALLSITGLAMLLFQLRTDIPWKNFFPYFFFGLAVAGRKHYEAYIYGFIIDEKKNPITGVRIEVADIKTGQILAHGMTNKIGRFAIRNVFDKPYLKLIVTKEGFIKKELTSATDTKKESMVTLYTKDHVQIPNILGFKHVAGELFEFTLFVSFLLELMFLFSFGVAMTLPFFLISLFNLLLWIMYTKERSLLK